MRYITDLHIHSKYSRSTSRQLVLPEIHRWARIKGIDIVATGDFTHPAWMEHIERELEPAGHGLFRLKKAAPGADVRFILGTEISCIYKKADRCRRQHVLVLVPDLAAARRIQRDLARVGNIASDGRPILGLDAKALAGIAWEADEDAMVIPAHAWTPWFSVFGSKSGFDTLEECYEEYADRIWAIETGLSSDPLMNWRLSQLDDIMLVSNSDAHSLENMGREANAFEMDEPSYFAIRDILKNKDRRRFLHTIEFYPEEGKYHCDGHRACSQRLDPAETEKRKGLCPGCGKPVTVGVLNRVHELADRTEQEALAVSEKKGFVPYRSIVPLPEIIAEYMGVGKKSKRVQAEYERMIREGGNEFAMLLDASERDLAEFTQPGIAEGIRRMRRGELRIRAGYDGEYGSIALFSEEERQDYARQETLF